MFDVHDGLARVRPWRRRFQYVFLGRSTKVPSRVDMFLKQTGLSDYLMATIEKDVVTMAGWIRVRDRTD